MGRSGRAGTADGTLGRTVRSGFRIGFAENVIDTVRCG